MRIALAGKIKAGKSTVATYLDATYDSITVSIAGQLKQRLVEAGVDREDLFERKPELVRDLMQIFGEVIRGQDEDFWIKTALGEADAGEDAGFDLVVIDDLRYRNEAIMLREEGWLLVRLVCTNAPDPGVAGTHLSEIDLDDWDDWDLVIKAKYGDLHALFSGIDSLIVKEE